MDYRLIPIRVLSCVVRQFDYEYDHVRRHLRSSPLIADETDAGMEAPAPESVRRIGGVFGSSLSCPTFFFGGVRWMVELPSGGRPCRESCFSRLVCLELVVF